MKANFTGDFKQTDLIRLSFDDTEIKKETDPESLFERVRRKYGDTLNGGKH